MAHGQSAILREIGQRFCVLREKDRGAAYRTFIHDMMDHLHELVPAVMSMKDAMDLVTGVEKNFPQTGGGEKGKTMLDLFREFLNELEPGPIKRRKVS